MPDAQAPHWCFQCPECGLGDHEVGHLIAPDEPYCVVCLEEEGRLVRLERWEETDQARLRVALVAA